MRLSSHLKMRRTSIFVPLAVLRVKTVRRLSRRYQRPRRQRRRKPSPSRGRSGRRLQRRQTTEKNEGDKSSLFFGISPAISRNPATGQLHGRGRGDAIKRLHALRDSIWQIKRYLYRRICAGTFAPLAEASDVQADKSLLRRMTVWLMPTRPSKPSKTETLLFNSRISCNNNQGGGSPAVLFPTDSSQTRNIFYNSSYEGLKNWVYNKRCIPEGLLDLLSGTSSREPVDRRDCLFTPKGGHRIRIPSDAHRTVMWSAWHSGRPKSPQTGFGFHSGNAVGLWPVSPANRFGMLNRAFRI